MKTLTLPLASLVALVTLTVPAGAQPRFTGHGFNPAGVYHMTISGAADLEVSTNLQAWSKFASVSQETTLDDLQSRRLEWRFYRTHGHSNITGYIRVPIPAGKMALLGNPFAGALRLDLQEARRAMFGTTNPAVRISLFSAGKFEPHTLDATSGAWTPPLRPIRVQEGFSIENVGSNSITFRMSGEVREGQFNTTLPAGPSLVVPPVPQPGPVADVLGIPGKDGMQVDFFNEETQKYQTSTYDTIENGWLPKLPDYRPGRSLVLRTPQPVTWSKSFPSAAK